MALFDMMFDSRTPGFAVAPTTPSLFVGGGGGEVVAQSTIDEQLFSSSAVRQQFVPSSSSSTEIGAFDPFPRLPTSITRAAIAEEEDAQLLVDMASSVTATSLAAAAADEHSEKVDAILQQAQSRALASITGSGSSIVIASGGGRRKLVPKRNPAAVPFTPFSSSSSTTKKKKKTYTSRDAEDALKAKERSYTSFYRRAIVEDVAIICAHLIRPSNPLTMSEFFEFAWNGVKGKNKLLSDEPVRAAALKLIVDRFGPLPTSSSSSSAKIALLEKDDRSTDDLFKNDVTPSDFLKMLAKARAEVGIPSSSSSGGGTKKRALVSSTTTTEGKPKKKQKKSSPDLETESPPPLLLHVSSHDDVVPPPPPSSSTTTDNIYCTEVETCKIQLDAIELACRDAETKCATLRTDTDAAREKLQDAQRAFDLARLALENSNTELVGAQEKLAAADAELRELVEAKQFSEKSYQESLQKSSTATAVAIECMNCRRRLGKKDGRMGLSFTCGHVCCDVCKLAVVNAAYELATADPEHLKPVVCPCCAHPELGVSIDPKFNAQIASVVPPSAKGLIDPFTIRSRLSPPPRSTTTTSSPLTRDEDIVTKIAEHQLTKFPHLFLESIRMVQTFCPKCKKVNPTRGCSVRSLEIERCTNPACSVLLCGKCGKLLHIGKQCSSTVVVLH
jgi:hypothetical protein